MAKALMLQGSGSDAGKSLICAGLIRAFKRRGLRVLPFKPQNMSNNAAVAESNNGDNGEIGRAQALQAQAAGVSAHVDMNPILLKPQSSVHGEAKAGSQIIVQGRYWGEATARDYYRLKDKLLPFVEQSFRRLGSSADLIIVEGAGSPAEVNLRHGDLANMGFAEHFQVPVLLVGDIERGGVIANLVGTHRLLPPQDRDLIKGFIINKFRGDVSLFDEAVNVIGEQTGWACCGIVPWLEEARYLPQEDALGLEAIKHSEARKKPKSATVRIGVLRLRHIANFDDLDALRAEACVDLRIIEAGAAVPGDLHALIIPGSKATIADYRYLCEQGWDTDIAAHVRRGGMLIGLCGGYQMLGRVIEDRAGLEGAKESVQALGYLEMQTILGGDKTLSQSTAQESLFGGYVQGYEIHLGQSHLQKAHLQEGAPNGTDVFLRTDAGAIIGAMSRDRRIIGGYMHGLFGNDEFRRNFLRQFTDYKESYGSLDILVEETLDRLATHIESHCDLDLMKSLCEN